MSSYLLSIMVWGLSLTLVLFGVAWSARRIGRVEHTALFFAGTILILAASQITRPPFAGSPFLPLVAILPIITSVLSAKRR